MSIDLTCTDSESHRCRCGEGTNVKDDVPRGKSSIKVHSFFSELQTRTYLHRIQIPLPDHETKDSFRKELAVRIVLLWHVTVVSINATENGKRSLDSNFVLCWPSRVSALPSKCGDRWSQS